MAYPRIGSPRITRKIEQLILNTKRASPRERRLNALLEDIQVREAALLDAAGRRELAALKREARALRYEVIAFNPGWRSRIATSKAFRATLQGPVVRQRRALEALALSLKNLQAARVTHAAAKAEALASGAIEPEPTDPARA